MMINMKNVPDQCPECKGAVRFFHSPEGTRVVCKDKCQGYKVIASCKRWADEYVNGDKL
jgi:hypothetical protein